VVVPGVDGATTFIVTMEGMQMAKAAKRVFKGFVRCELNKSEASDFKSWSDATSDLDLFTLVMELCDSGYKFSCGENAQGMGASLTNVEGPVDSRGYVLSAFAGDPNRAVRAVMYKHYVKLAAAWPVGGEEGWDLG
jgi:hypothetical protein